jgi:transcriptional regulator with XRE-family HTH domain
MRTPDQRGRYGRWLVAAREARGWTTAQRALDAMAAVGIRIGKSTYAEYESGTKAPSRNHLPLLESFWGPPEPLQATETPDSLVAALHAQTVAISELVAVLREGSEDRESRLRTLEAVVSVLLPRDDEASLGQLVPHETTG